MSFRAGISVSDVIQIATVFDLPGCGYTAATVEEIREMLPIAVAEHLGWLAGHGEHVDATDVSVSIVEEIDAAKAEGVEGEFVFKDDGRPLTGDDAEHALRWMAYSRHDLLEASRNVPDEILHWRPPLSAMARVDPWKPSALTIREILQDIASSEFYYRSGLRDGRSDDDRPEELIDLALQRERTIAALRSVAGEDRGRVFAPRRSWQSSTERWTARKVVRRILAHERFHTAEIRQRLSWVLLGVPEFSRATG